MNECILPCSINHYQYTQATAFLFPQALPATSPIQLSQQSFLELHGCFFSSLIPLVRIGPRPGQFLFPCGVIDIPCGCAIYVAERDTLTALSYRPPIARHIKRRRRTHSWNLDACCCCCYCCCDFFQLHICYSSGERLAATLRDGEWPLFCLCAAKRVWI